MKIARYKSLHVRFHLSEKSRISKSIKTESGLVIDKGWEEGGTGNDCSVGTGFPLGAMKMLGVQMEVLVAQHCECV